MPLPAHDARRRLPGGGSSGNAGRSWRSVIPMAVSILLHLALLVWFASTHLENRGGNDGDARALVIDTIIAAPRPVEVIPRIVLPPPPIDAAAPAKANPSAPATSPTSANSPSRTESSAPGTSNGAGSSTHAAIDPSRSSFFGLQTRGRRIVYVIDRSGSMEEAGVWDAVRLELLASLRKLPRGSRFGVVVYNQRPQVLDLRTRDLALPTPANVDRVERLLADLPPIGGTNHFDALRKAAAMNPDAVYWFTDADDLTPTLAGDIEKLFNSRRGVRPALCLLQWKSTDPGRTALAERLCRHTGGDHRQISDSVLNPAESFLRSN